MGTLRSLRNTLSLFVPPKPNDTPLCTQQTLYPCRLASLILRQRVLPSAASAVHYHFACCRSNLSRSPTALIASSASCCASVIFGGLTVRGRQARGEPLCCRGGRALLGWVLKHGPRACMRHVCGPLLEGLGGGLGLVILRHGCGRAVSEGAVATAGRARTLVCSGLAGALASPRIRFSKASMSSIASCPSSSDFSSN